jgi:TRAP-type C4-dicarboxylate transport system substrate-binding protein
MVRRRIAVRFFVAAAAALFAAIAAPATAADFTMKIGLGTMNDIQHQWANWYKEAIESGSKGRIEVKIFPRNQLGTIASQIEGVKLGTVEAFVSPVDFFAGVDPRFGVFSAPVLFKSAEQAAKVVLDPALNKETLALGSDKGLEVVSIFTYAQAHYFAKQPMRMLDDFKGKKLRINATAAERAKMRQFGATGVPMDLAEVVPGLQQGTIDGTMSATAVFVNLKFNDIGKVITRVNDTMIISIGAVSKAWLAKLPSDLRQVVIESGNKLQQRTCDYSRELDQTMAKKWTDAGGEFVALPANDAARVLQLLSGVGEEVTKENPAVHAFYRKVLATSQKY